MNASSTVKHDNSHTGKALWVITARKENDSNTRIEMKEDGDVLLFTRNLINIDSPSHELMHYCRIGSFPVNYVAMQRWVWLITNRELNCEGVGGGWPGGGEGRIYTSTVSEGG